MIPFRNVIVCHMEPGSENHVGGTFGHYDAITRPQDLGVIGRYLLSHDDLYIHVIERKQDPEVSGQRRGLPAFQKIAEEIGPYVTPYPSYWTNPSHSVAKPFYSWTREPQDLEQLTLDDITSGKTQLTVIVQRMKPGSEADIARVFTESDAGSLPADLGVVGRWLYSIEDVFVHLLEQDAEMAAATRGRHNGQPAFKKVMEGLAPFVSPYRPEGWQTPRDSMAHVFYRWQAPDWGSPPPAEPVEAGAGSWGGGQSSGSWGGQSSGGSWGGQG